MTSTIAKPFNLRIHLNLEQIMNLRIQNSQSMINLKRTRSILEAFSKGGLQFTQNLIPDYCNFLSLRESGILMNYPISFGRWRIRQEESENHQWVGEHWRWMWREGHQFREDLWWGYWERIWFARTAVLGFLPEEVQKNLYRYWITSLTPLIQIFFFYQWIKMRQHRYW